LKTSTSAVRTAYVECMICCFNHNTLSQAGPLLPSLLKKVEKAGAQPTQLPTVVEGLAASCLLIKVALIDDSYDAKLGSFWSVVLDMEHQIFLSDKFLSQCPPSALLLVAKLCGQLLNAKKKSDEQMQPVHRALIFCATSHDQVVRESSKTLIKSVVQALGGSRLAGFMLVELTRYLDNCAVSPKEIISNESEDGTKKDISGKVYVDAILAVCYGSKEAEDAADLAMKSFLCCHHQLVVGVDPRLWIKLLMHNNLHPAKFVEQNSSAFRKMLIENFQNGPCHYNALKTLLAVDTSSILAAVIASSTAKLSNPDILSVTQTDYMIFLTPEGELYDKSVVSSDTNEGILNAKNMKRESKAYSYKEQVEEMQLRKELAEKRKKKGVKDEPEMSQKQKEAKRLQLEKEAAIRSRVCDLNKTLYEAIAMLNATVEGNPAALVFYFKDLINVLQQTFKSHLAAPQTSKLFVRLGGCVFEQENKSLSQLVAYTSLRLCQPRCDIDAAWEEEQLSSAIQRVVNLLDAEIAPKKKTSLGAPAFCYCFPLLKISLLSPMFGISSSTPNESFVTRCLHFISEHAKMRSDSGVASHDPNLLPRKIMFDLLIEIIGSTSSRLQQVACNTFTEVAMSGSGNPGCAQARDDEIAALLAALENPLPVVRDTAVRGLLTMKKALPGPKDPLSLRFHRRLFVAKYDVSPENR
jgi:hypothetical protein